ncbi:MAG: hypothetical protein PHZ19_08870 [Candidatus Thermoplasmatota archaeon]|nr:hypothetical protein [Candidatus Thermoplasmatota archaeon]
MSELDKYTLNLDDWHTPATEYPEIQEGNVRIRKLKYTRGCYEMYGIDGMLIYEVMKPLIITQLQELRGKRWHSWMVDDPPHYRAMEIYAQHSHGRVLVAGLGLGLVLHALVKNPDVTEIVVVEKNIDVIRLMCDLIPPKPRIVHDDFLTYVDRGLGKWDTIIVDLWVSRNVDEKMRLFREEVVPMAVYLNTKFPDTQKVFHGFHTLSDIKHTTPEMLDLIKRVM